MKAKHNLMLHISILLVLWVIWFFSSEHILVAYIPEQHDVIIWLFLTAIGLIGIFILVLLSYIISSIIRRKKLK